VEATISRVATMRAAILTAPRIIHVRPVASPAPQAGEILLRVEGCGVCGSNVPVWHGDAGAAYPLPAGAPGHEAWGSVEELGAGVKGIGLGERVAALTYNSFAEYDVAAASTVVPLPAELDGEPFPGEALGCALNIFRRSEIRAGTTVGIVGIGFLGALLVQLCSAAGARVLALSRRESALEVARASGADEALALDADLPDETCDVAIEAAGVQQTLDVATRLTRTRGRLVVAGFHQNGPRTVDMQLWNWRGLDVINAHERDPAVYVAGMRAAVDAVVDGRLSPGPLYTHTFPLERAGDAMDAARAREDGFMKALVLT
jgi:threonine dehydrogenase-like Zn-dependent dehydrogenase